MSAKRIVPLVAAVALGLTAVADAQTLYRWVDKDGKVQFSDVPPNSDVKVTEKAVRAGEPDSQLSFATQVAMKNNPVTLYSGRDCTEACGQARNLLAKRGIPYSERDAQGNQEAADALKAMIDDLFIPTLAVGKVPLKGFSENAWHSALDTAGYPRTILPGQMPPKAPEPVKKAEPAVAPAAQEPPQQVELTTERR